jgi:hypothetical protein
MNVRRDDGRYLPQLYVEKFADNCTRILPDFAAALGTVVCEIMNAMRALVGLFVATFFPAASVFGQIVHATVEGSFFFVTPPPVPYRVLSDPAPYRIDAFYDSTLPGRPTETRTIFDTDWTSPPPDSPNYIHWRSEGNDWTVPVTQLSLGTDGRFFITYSTRVPYLSVILNLTDETPLDRLPAPPFEFSSTAADLGLISGGALPISENRVYFDGTVTRFDVEIVPVPEPATYAAFASAGLLAIILARRQYASRRVPGST